MRRIFSGLTLFALGLLTSQLVLELRAAPSEIEGSPNVAVDTYRNSKGTYVLFSNGRICDAKTGAATDLGHPYTAPAPGANLADGIGQVGGKSLGAPNVAIKAIPRPDATYVLFADGKLQKPANADAGAPGGAGPTRVIMGLSNAAEAGENTPGYSFESNGYVRFDEPFSTPPTVLEYSPPSGDSETGRSPAAFNCRLLQDGNGFYPTSGGNFQTAQFFIASGE